MAQPSEQPDKPSRNPGRNHPRHWWRSTWFEVLVGIVVAAGLAMLLTAIYIARHAEPILHKRVIETLSRRFNSPVELDQLHISVARGLQVQGSGLRILYLAGPTLPSQEKNAPAMLAVRNFTFRISMHELLRLRARVTTVYMQGLEVHVPPHRDHSGLLAGETADAAHPGPPPTQPKIALLVDRILCTDAKVFIETDKPGKEPLEFDILNLDLTDVGSAWPLLYQADLVNPKPKGNVHAFGHFGPWVGADPRSTPLDGDYRFDHAELSSIKGLGGNLSSAGHFAGQLGHLTIDGTSSVPDFSLDVSNHPVPLLATFHAFVDGTTGDTTLAPVQATLGRSEFTCTGAVVRVKDKGHDIALTVSMAHGRIEDLLELGMKTQPPVIRGYVAMKAKLHIPPGPGRVAAKLEISGTLSVTAVEFSNAKLQDRIDALSLRAQGKPQEVKAAGSDRLPEVASQMALNVALAHELMTVDSLVYQVPGAKVDLRGIYSLDGNIFEFKGHVRTDATASQMTTGWKSFLLKAVDPLLKRNGAGVELPIALSGAKGDIQFGLAMHGADETPAQMADDLKTRRQAQAAPPQ